MLFSLVQVFAAFGVPALADRSRDRRPWLALVLVSTVAGSERGGDGRGGFGQIWRRGPARLDLTIGGWCCGFAPLKRAGDR
jgi:hypothetical protein